MVIKLIIKLIKLIKLIITWLSTLVSESVKETHKSQGDGYNASQQILLKCPYPSRVRHSTQKFWMHGDNCRKSEFMTTGMEFTDFVGV